MATAGSSNELSRVAPANEHSGQADTAAEVTVCRSNGIRKGQLLSAFFSADKILRENILYDQLMNLRYWHLIFSHFLCLTSIPRFISAAPLRQ